MNTTIKTLSTVSALGADCVVSNGVAYITGLQPMLVSGIKPTSVVAPVT
jgi:enoyl reductase-like protein